MGGIPICYYLRGIIRTATLPSKFDTPMFWDQEDLKELQGTAVVGACAIPCPVTSGDMISYRQNRESGRREGLSREAASCSEGEIKLLVAPLCSRFLNSLGHM